MQVTPRNLFTESQFGACGYKCTILCLLHILKLWFCLGFVGLVVLVM